MALNKVILKVNNRKVYYKKKIVEKMTIAFLDLEHCYSDLKKCGRVMIP